MLLSRRSRGGTPRRDRESNGIHENRKSGIAGTWKIGVIISEGEGNETKTEHEKPALSHSAAGQGCGQASDYKLSP